ncbi:MAG: hypothetical protein FD157_4069 [Rhodocyclaceae bacterium]|nr:MAG: hypothetical protein FD157_4069 [Rhodocyclaceae bacterium]TNC98009.1 MAG: hypothetical protein FD118_4078 [Rhodocyclaceae bacterium]
MTPALSIFKRARRPLNLLAGAIFLSLTLVFGSIYGRDTLKKGLAQSRVQLGAQQPNLTAKQQELRNIQAHIGQFRAFRTQGLVGSADREGWVEQLVVSREQLKLADTLSYTLKPPQAMTDAATPDPAVVASPDAPTVHDLDFELKGVHELELLNLLQDYQARVHGRFRLQSCRFSEPTQAGLFAQCTLRFFNLREAAKPPGS